MSAQTQNQDEPSYLAFARANVREALSSSPGVVRGLIERIDRDTRAAESTKPDRDELAALLFTTDNARSVMPWAEWEHAKNEPRLTEYVYAMADALIAAGYVKAAA